MLTDENIEDIFELIHRHAELLVVAASAEAAWQAIVKAQGGREGFAAQLKIDAHEHRQAARAHEERILSILQESQQ